MTTPAEESLLLAAPMGELEVRLSHPSQAATALAIVCHPHPLFGGTLDNKVVYTLARTFRQAGAITARFNFRGVGKSAGQFAEGIGETEDLLWLVNWLKQRYPASPTLWLAGFSFGSYVALRAHAPAGAARLVLVAPPVARFDFSATQLGVNVPTLVLQGTLDTVVAETAVTDWVHSQQPAPVYQVLTGADHFFHGHLGWLRDTVSAWLESSS